LAAESTVHGAGRALGRREATGVIDRKTGEVKRAGKVTPEMMRAWVDRAGIELRGAGLDESPDCYKRLAEVLEAVGDTVRILHRLTPAGVAMAGAKGALSAVNSGLEINGEEPRTHRGPTSERWWCPQVERKPCGVVSAFAGFCSTQLNGLRRLRRLKKKERLVYSMDSSISLNRKVLPERESSSPFFGTSPSKRGA